MAAAKKEGYGITLHRKSSRVLDSALCRLTIVKPPAVDSKTRSFVFVHPFLHSESNRERLPRGSVCSDEFSTSNCLFVQQKGDETTLVVPKSPSILRSVTTMAIKELAEKKFGWAVEERPVAFSEVKQGAYAECAAVGRSMSLHTTEASFS